MRRFSGKVAYDPEMDPSTWGGYRPGFLFGQPKGWKGELAHQKAATTLRKRIATIRAPEERKRLAREAAELDVAELVHRMAGALQMALQRLHDTPIPVGQYERHVNYQKLHNVLVEMRIKCGVKFEDEDIEYNEKMDLDRVHLSDDRNEHREEMEYQRQARMMQKKDAADHFAAFVNRQAEARRKP